MTIGAATLWAQKALSGAGIDGARSEARLLVRLATGFSTERQIADPEIRLDEDQMTALRDSVARRSRHEPMAQILGRREFWSLDFVVTPETLDPRPDSETVIAAVLGGLDSRTESYQVLDLGTGTGCLLLALLSELPAATGVGVDIEPETARVAQTNAERLGLSERAGFIAGDWTAALDCRFDVVVCNPPYVPTSEIETLQPEVARFEPRRALDGGPDGLECYRALLPVLPGVLKPSGMAVFEVGAGQAGAVTDLLLRYGFTGHAQHADLAGTQRCVSAKLGKNHEAR